MYAYIEVPSAALSTASAWTKVSALLDALDGAGPHVRSHDGKRLMPTR